jgi:hypothetical protein
MTPRDYQLIGSHLDVALFLALGLLGVLIPHKLIGTKGTDEERRKKIRVLKICGALLVLVAVAKLIW